MTVPPGQPTEAVPVCYRHSNRPTGLRCTRCERPACTECLREASVGFQCVDCVNEGQRGVRQPVTVAGARLSGQSVLVPALIVINVVIFGITAYQANSIMGNTTATLFRQWAMVPAFAAVNGEWWRLFTAGFLHIGPLHLLVNMASLWMIGRDMERTLGKVRFLAVYLLSMVGGGVAVFLFGAALQPVAGASTALYGLLGCYLIAILRLKLDPKQILFTIGINVVISFSVPNISLLGHFGGFVIGTAAMAGIVYAPQRNRNLWQAGGLVAIAVVLAAMYLTRAPQLVAQICAAYDCTS